MKLDKNSTVPPIWILTILFYLLRSIAEPLKYLFVLSFGILLISYTYFFIIHYRKNSIRKFVFATKEFQVLGLFLASAILLSTHIEVLSIKSFINFLGIAVLFLIYFEYKDHIQLIRLFRGWIFLTLIIGTLGLLKWLNFILEFNLGFFSVFYKYGSSLVSEYNFYASYFIISLVIYFYALHKKIVQPRLITNQTIVFLFLLNIVLSGSRRGLIILVIFLLVLIYLLVIKRQEKQELFYRNAFCFNALIFSLLLLFVTLLPFRSKIIQEQSTKTRIAITVYRYSTIFSPNLTYGILYVKLWPRTAEYENEQPDWEKYATYNNLVENKIEYQDFKNEFWLQFHKERNNDNLFYNGNLENGQNFWGVSAPDSIKHEIINTKYGNALRVSRFNGKGYWPLTYKGRDIFYHEGVTYTYKFKYRVLKGSEVPFMIGWWVNEGEGFKNRLPYNIRKLDTEWFEFTASYKFKSDQHNLQTFMNSQLANTVIDFADIELTCDDTINRPRYTDQLMHLENPNLFYNSNFENGLKFWGSETPDTVGHELIETLFGKAIRVTRKEGEGYWPLVYHGRDIFYYKDLTYYFRFKFRVIEGGKTPFNIGWWMPREEKNPYNLHKDIFPLNDGWSECIATYKFENDYYGKIMNFMNSQKSNTIIDFADIELLCNDSLHRPMYCDKNIDIIKILEETRINQQLKIENIQLLSDRTARWKYAIELWKNEYSWSNKVFGGGFDYLEMFGQKFYPDEDRIDYPHNPIISSFLYSGIIGGIFYIYFLVLSFWYYWKYRKHNLLFFILYLITFAFTFISSDSHFNVPIFAMLSLVPFITRYVVTEKENKNPA